MFGEMEELEYTCMFVANFTGRGGGGGGEGGFFVQKTCLPRVNAYELNGAHIL